MRREIAWLAVGVLGATGACRSRQVPAGLALEPGASHTARVTGGGASAELTIEATRDEVIDPEPIGSYPFTIAE